MEQYDFLQIIQARAARLAVGPSTARNQGGGGAVTASRRFLAHLDLSRFAEPDPDSFAQILEDVTHELAAALPATVTSWGLARKVLNIFVRDALYSSHLQAAFRLSVAEPHMEIPLDSITAKGIVGSAAARVPAWPGVKKLSPQISAAYQAAAAHIGARQGLLRVHLDALWWSRSEEFINLGTGESSSRDSTPALYVERSTYAGPRMLSAVCAGDIIGIEHALATRDLARRRGTKAPSYSCVECGLPVRAHKAGGHSKAHFEHLERNPGCPLSDPLRT